MQLISFNPYNTTILNFNETNNISKHIFHHNNNNNKLLTNHNININPNVYNIFYFLI